MIIQLEINKSIFLKEKKSKYYLSMTLSMTLLYILSNKTV